MIFVPFFAHGNIVLRTRYRLGPPAGLPVGNPRRMRGFVALRPIRADAPWYLI